MLRKRKQVRRRRRVPIAQRIREIGPRLHTAFRRARVALWRFKRSPEQQDRAAMFATFAFISLFAIGSVDAIITGGADFAPGSAYAAEYRPARITPLEAPAIEPAVVEEAAAETTKTVGEIDYSVTNEILLGGPEEELAAVAQAPVVIEGFAFDTEKLQAMEPSAGAPDAEPLL